MEGSIFVKTPTSLRLIARKMPNFVDQLSKMPRYPVVAGAVLLAFGINTIIFGTVASQGTVGQNNLEMKGTCI